MSLSVGGCSRGHLYKKPLMRGSSVRNSCSSAASKISKVSSDPALEGSSAENIPLPSSAYVRDVACQAPGALALAASRLRFCAVALARCDAILESRAARIVPAGKPHDTSRAGAPSAATAVAVGFSRAGCICGNVRAGSAGVVATLASVAAEPCRRSPCSFRGLEAIGLPNLDLLSTGTAPLAIALAAARGVLGAEGAGLGNTRGEGRPALVARIRRGHDAQGPAPGAAASRATGLLGTLQVGGHGSRVASAAHVALVLCSEAAYARPSVSSVIVVVVIVVVAIARLPPLAILVVIVISVVIVIPVVHGVRTLVAIIIVIVLDTGSVLVIRRPHCWCGVLQLLANFRTHLPPTQLTEGETAFLPRRVP
mmetsp:Transcript_11191/g.22695  ORF Transcript_11191/g.22695 Transcript_11191/m.22695 type:complete len:368 (+) Transcript_11191:73-1176(+)